MGKANFTFVSRALRTLSLLMVFSLMGWQGALAQNITDISQDCDGSVTVTFDCDGQIEIEDVNGDAVVTSTDQSPVTFAGGNFTAGDDYTVVLSCNGASSSDVFTAVDPGPTINTSAEVDPSCATSTDGGFTFHIEDEGCTETTFDVEILDAANQPVTGLTVTDINGDPSTLEGVFGNPDPDIGSVRTVEGLGTGTYSVSLTLNTTINGGGNCNHAPGCIDAATASVTLESADDEGPELGVTVEDALVGLLIGQGVVADNEDITVNLNDFIDGGEISTGTDCCATIDFSFLSGDDCDGDVTIDVEVVSGNVSVNNFSGNGGGVLSAIFCAGTSSFKITATDDSGNSSSVTVEGTVAGSGAPVSISCVDVRVTLTDDCTFPLTVQNVGAAQGLDCVTNELYVIIDDGVPNKGQVDGVGTFPYGIVDANDELVCWGEVTAEDKTAPTIECPEDAHVECFLIDDVLNNPASVNRNNEDRRGFVFTGSMEALTASNATRVTPLNQYGWYDDCSAIASVDWNDQVQYYTCDQNDDYTAIISRRFTVRDEFGMASSCVQEIKVERIGIEDFMHVERDLVGGSANDFVYNEDDDKWEYTVNTCDADPTASPATVFPRFKGKGIDGRASDGNFYDLDDVSCDLSTEVKTHQFLNVCTDGSYKEEVAIKVFDWCLGMVDNREDFNYVVKVGDFSAPTRQSGSCIIETTASTAEMLLPLLPASLSEAQIAANSCGMVSTGPMNCTAAMNVSLSALESRFGNLVNDCSDDLSVSVEVLSYLPVTIGKIPTGDTAWVKGDYQRQGDMIMGLPEGLHALHLNISDGCYNTGNFFLYFQVMDLVRPVMKCDDELRVTLVEGDDKLGIGGYALATAADVDEGSWDNCELVDLHVRRSFLNDPSGSARADWIAKNDPAGDDRLTDESGNRFGGDDYTPWADLVEFFCGDVTVIGPDDGGVRVELRGTDRKGNQSICWLDVEVENGTNFGVELGGGDRLIDCSDIPANLEDIDEAWVNGLGISADITGIAGCQVGSAGLLITPNLNQCGIGTITVGIDPASVSDLETKNAVTIDDTEYTITVVGDYDYWVKFPADDEYFCEDEAAAGIEYETNSCDLITVYEDDERFESVADPDACYKIFRTYKVINWCEYDGESQPVIVSRDWDAHNNSQCNINWDNGIGENPDRTDDAGEYNLNPTEPDGDGQPGNTDLYVIVDVNNRDLAPIDYNRNGIRAAEGELDIVYYDNNSDPYDNSTADLWGDDDVSGPLSSYAWASNPEYGTVRNRFSSRYDEGYWWAVIRGSYNCLAGDNGELFESAWFDDVFAADNPDGNSADGVIYDIDGNDFQDDTDNRYGSFGYWQYTQHIVVYDDSDPVATLDVDEEICTIASDCLGDVPFTVTVTDPCSEASISASYDLAGGFATGEMTDNGDGTFSATVEGAPLGKHILVVTITDGCGNVATVTDELEVVDCKGPAPICHDGIVVELMPTEDGAGMAEVWASDLIASPINDCTALSNDASGFGEVPVEAYSIFLNDGFVNYDTAVANTDDPTGIFFDCTDAGTEPMVRVYAEDEAGNVDYCLTFVRVQDNNSVCAPAAGGSIAGAVATETAANVEGVEVQLSGARSMMYMTDASGSFGFDGLAQGGDYTVTPQKDLNHLNGVSTFDLVLISKHILGVSQLDSPYKMVAADVNNSQSITTLDLIQLRKLILNIDTEFANNTSWRFIDKSHVFADPSNPWSAPIPEFKNINNLASNAEAEFVATKIGDVNGSATVEARAATGDFAINTAEQAMIAGNEYTIDFSADMADIAGYQFTLDVANAEIVDVIYGAAKAENFGVFTKEGVITTSFNGEAAGTLFSVVVRATADAKVSESVQISSRYTAAEAYTNDAEQLNVNLNIAGATATEAAFALNQNTPNPFQGETQIGFNLPEAQEATITLQDVAGRTVKMIEGDFAKGYNQVTIGANDLPSAGVYFYTLTAGDKSATKKLILVDALNR